ncbi:hypothetical protein BT69DRAFT_1235977 [Atractiella rhizophila]|nr:hypothetical protein BT69DRAFT_1235977 [Atractiella rhizophila]
MSRTQLPYASARRPPSQDLRLPTGPGTGRASPARNGNPSGRSSPGPMNKSTQLLKRLGGVENGYGSGGRESVHDEADYFDNEGEGETISFGSSSQTQVTSPTSILSDPMKKDQELYLASKSIAAFTKSSNVGGGRTGRKRQGTGSSTGTNGTAFTTGTYARSIKGDEPAVPSLKRRPSKATTMGLGGGDGGMKAGKDYPDTPVFRELAETLRRAKVGFPGLFVGGVRGDGEEEEDGLFNPVQIALSLLEKEGGDAEDGGGGATTSKELKTFNTLLSSLNTAVSRTLDPTYRPLLSSLNTHSSLLSSLGSAQKQILDLKRNLSEVREMVVGVGGGGEGVKQFVGNSATGSELRMMWGKLKEFGEMERILDTIDRLKSVPDRLESLMSEKRFLQAVVLLVRSLRTINKSEMLEIGALTELRSYLKSQEGQLLDILLEELHNHLYLKSYYCEARWRAYTRGQLKLPEVEFGEEDENMGKSSWGERNVMVGGAAAMAGGSGAGLSNVSVLELEGKKGKKLDRFLASLSSKASHDPLLDEFAEDLSLAGPDSSAVAGGAEELEAPPSPLPGMGAGIGQSLSNLNLAGEEKGEKKNPESDSFSYIEGLLESLACLGKLGVGLDAILQRISSELYALVQGTVEEVHERNEANRRFSFAVSLPSSSQHAHRSSVLSSRLSLQTRDRGSIASVSSIYSNPPASAPGLPREFFSKEKDGSSSVEKDNEILRDLFWTTYSKLDAVLQGFRVAYEVAARITERKEFRESGARVGSLLSLNEVWKPVQQEVRTLLNDYLTDDEGTATSLRNPLTSISEILREGRFNRDKSKPLFRFSDSDFKTSSRVLKDHEEEMNRALKAAVPGLVSAATENTTSISSNVIISSMITDDRFSATTGSTAGSGSHKILVKADAFNISVLFAPTLSFLERVKDIMPGGLLGDEDRGFEGFMDEFVLNTFLPQLEEKVTNVFHQAVGGLDAFQEDPNWRNLSPVPVFKSVSSLINLIDSLCTMLQSTPFHREHYGRLIFGVVIQFYQKCSERFKDLTFKEVGETSSRDQESPYKYSAQLAQQAGIAGALMKLKDAASNPNSMAYRNASIEETQLELKVKGDKYISPEELISSFKKLTALGTLYSSLRLFFSHIISLKSDDPSSPSAPLAELFRKQQEQAENGAVGLPMTKDMSTRFDGLVKTYEQLCDGILMTLRLELRVETMFYLDHLQEGNYVLEQNMSEPDSYVMDLNNFLVKFDDALALTLKEDEQRFVFSGLSKFVDQLLVSCVRGFRAMNNEGAVKMIRSILSLQQNLKNLGTYNADAQGDMERSRRFWDLFSKGPKGMIETIKSGRLDYSFEDYKNLLSLMCGIEPSSSSPDNPPLSAGLGASAINRRVFNEFIIELHSLVPEEYDD